jgi:hypothetical protein
MARKRWTAQTEVSESLLKFREKRKWQIALRRYILEKNKSSFYAPYFGLDINSFRQWIELQFDEDVNWENFSQAWQLDHIVPVAYFDFENEDDMKLCWNFVNIRVEKLQLNKNRGNRIDVLAAKSYFQDIFQRTNYQICKKMVEKIEQIELSQISSNEDLENFIQENKQYLETISSFSSYDFDRLNTGVPVNDIVFEKEFFKKFG